MSASIHAVYRRDDSGQLACIHCDTVARHGPAVSKDVQLLCIAGGYVSSDHLLMGYRDTRQSWVSQSAGSIRGFLGNAFTHRCAAQQADHPGGHADLIALPSGLSMTTEKHCDRAKSRLATEYLQG